MSELSNQATALLFYGDCFVLLEKFLDPISRTVLCHTYKYAYTKICFCVKNHITYSTDYIIKKRFCKNVVSHADMILDFEENEPDMWEKKYCALDKTELVRPKKYFCEYVVLGGYFGLLKWAKNNNCTLDVNTCINAAKCGRLDILIWAIENGCDLSSGNVRNVRVEIYNEAAKNGHLKIVEWALEKGFKEHDKVCMKAALGNHIDVLKFARQKGCKWDVNVTAAAAKVKNLEMLKWLRQNHCPWNELVTIIAANLGNLEMIKWAKEHGAVFVEATYVAAAEVHQFDTLVWLAEHGYSLDTDKQNQESYISREEISKWTYDKDRAEKREFYNRLAEVTDFFNGTFDYSVRLARIGHFKTLKLALKNKCYYKQELLEIMLQAVQSRLEDATTRQQNQNSCVPSFQHLFEIVHWLAQDNSKKGAKEFEKFLFDMMLVTMLPVTRPLISQKSSLLNKKF